ncbi:MAG: hypothetical protein L6R30_17290 [Thermoanaerobaculia bacterium]|nr:hypothetical protein [Thermoanaerobaculia bacterium]MCK6684159.1 hypothetical protein [Thermoanaerobaculia bacterium]
MTLRRVDIAILGSGFGGALLALVASRLGYSVALLERDRHPRFALGESTTPLLNLVLRQLATRYRLPFLIDRTKYGPWKRARPDLPVGVKRGFTFIGNEAGRFPSDAPGGILMVAASGSDEMADTHWERASFDAWLSDHARREIEAAGGIFREECDIRLVSLDEPVRLDADCPGERFQIEAGVLADATGSSGFLARELSIPEDVEGPQLRTWCVYGQLEGVPRATPLLDSLGYRTGRFPFPADDAALHHVFEGGWCWNLRFDDGRTSAGFVLDSGVSPGPCDLEPADLWREWVARHPLLGRFYGSAKPLVPFGLIPRLARRLARAAGPNWVLLPHAAAFVDPLLSGGLSHTALAIERLGRVFRRGIRRSALAEDLALYGGDLLGETRGLTRLIAGCRKSFGRFDVFSAFVMSYFVSASSLENARRQETRNGWDPGFLRLREPAFLHVLGKTLDDLDHVLAGEGPGPAGFLTDLRERLAPWNAEGFCDPAAGNLYAAGGG